MFITDTPQLKNKRKQSKETDYCVLNRWYDQMNRLAAKLNISSKFLTKPRSANSSSSQTQISNNENYKVFQQNQLRILNENTISANASTIN